MKTGLFLAACCLWVSACGEWSFGAADENKEGSLVTHSEAKTAAICTQGVLSQGRCIGPATAKCPKGVLLQERCVWDCNVEGARCDSDPMCGQHGIVRTQGECATLEIGKICGVWHMHLDDASVCVE